MKNTYMNLAIKFLFSSSLLAIENSKITYFFDFFNLFDFAFWRYIFAIRKKKKNAASVRKRLPFLPTRHCRRGPSSAVLCGYPPASCPAPAAAPENSRYILFSSSDLHPQPGATARVSSIALLASKPSLSCTQIAVFYASIGFLRPFNHRHWFHSVPSFLNFFLGLFLVPCFLRTSFQRWRRCSVKFVENPRKKQASREGRISKEGFLSLSALFCNPGTDFRCRICYELM